MAIESCRITTIDVLDLLEQIQGNINPERGFAEELEESIRKAIAELRAAHDFKSDVIGN
jgi:hypothetical protein